MERKTGLCSSAARRKASSPHGYQSTGIMGMLLQVRAFLANEVVGRVLFFR